MGNSTGGQGGPGGNGADHNGRAGSGGASSSAIAFPASLVIPPQVPDAVLIVSSQANHQSATVNTPFSTPLKVVVLDPCENPVPGAAVTFSAPGSGAGGTFAGAGTSVIVMADASGVATPPAFQANAIAGTYTVTASVSGGTTAAAFTLTNTSGAAAPATVTNVTSTTANGSYGVGSVVAVNVTFNSNVTVTGTPQLALNSGGSAKYTGGGGTNTLIFTYTVAAGDSSSRLDESSANALTLAGGSIVDGNSSAAVLTLPAPGTTGSLAVNTNIVIDTVAPTVTDFLVLFGTQSYSLVSNAATLASRLDLPWEITGIEVVFSKVINTADANSLTGITATGFSGLGTNTLIWTFAQLPTSSLPYSLGLKASGADGIRDLAANFLANGANNSQIFKVLIGDINGDGKVNAADLQLVKNALSAAYNVFVDFDGSGIVDFNDYRICRANVGKHL
jgi:hypothetical protein